MASRPKTPFAKLSKATQARYRREAAKQGVTVRQLRASPELVRAARGHKEESAEKKARRARIKQQHGVTPEKYTQLRKLRKAALEHAQSLLAAVSTKGPPDSDRMQANIASQSIRGLNALLEVRSGAQWRKLASYTYEHLIEEYPEYENDNEIVPQWYK